MSTRSKRSYFFSSNLATLSIFQLVTLRGSCRIYATLRSSCRVFATLRSSQRDGSNIAWPVTQLYFILYVIDLANKELPELHLILYMRVTSLYSDRSIGLHDSLWPAFFSWLIVHNFRVILDCTMYPNYIHL